LQHRFSELFAPGAEVKKTGRQGVPLTKIKDAGRGEKGENVTAKKSNKNRKQLGNTQSERRLDVPKKNDEQLLGRRSLRVGHNPA